MSARTDGIYHGTWCAVCETPFDLQRGEIGVSIGDMGERAHPLCKNPDQEEE